MKKSVYGNEDNLMEVRKEILELQVKIHGVYYPPKVLETKTKRQLTMIRNELKKRLK